MGLFSRDKPKIKVQTTKKDSFSGWLKCTHCTELIHTKELEQSCNCCPKCDYHYRLSSHQRIALLADSATFEELFSEIIPTDPLDFVDTEPYIERLQQAQVKANCSEAVITGVCRLQGQAIALAAMDFNFMGGSMGSATGERLTCLIEHALEQRLPLVIVAASGGARMQESIFSLMQMAKTSVALACLHEARVPYIAVLTNPTTGGVTASFASLGDIIIAEPNALIGFAGPRVIEQTIGRTLPVGAQKAEFLLKHGMIDCIVRRCDLKKTLVECISSLNSAQKHSSDAISWSETAQLTLKPTWDIAL
jgi:acetyl-CoA carboxylase carboxyl transferase subunit beta